VVGIVVGSARQGAVTGAVAVATLTDVNRFPTAAKAAMAAGVGRRDGRPPPPGGPADPLPAATLKALGDTGGQPASLAELTRKLIEMSRTER
jgi:hypothetical protein